MASIAQQDNFYIDLGEMGIDEIAAGFPKAIWDILAAKWKAGILPDCVFINNAGDFNKIVACLSDGEGNLRYISVAFEDQVLKIGQESQE